MKQAKRAAAITLLILLGSVFANCDDGTQPPRPGMLMLTLTTPVADDAAIQLSIRGPGIVSLHPVRSSEQIFWRVVSPDEAHAIVVGQLRTGLLINIEVADVSRVSQFQASVSEVAAQSGELRTQLTGYNLAIER